MFGGIPLSHQRARSLTGAPYARTQPADPLADQARVATGEADEQFQEGSVLVDTHRGPNSPGLPSWFWAAVGATNPFR